MKTIPFTRSVQHIEEKGNYLQTIARAYLKANGEWHEVVAYVPDTEEAVLYLRFPDDFAFNFKELP